MVVKRAMTLLEITIVLVIIGVLSTLAVPNYMRQLEMSKNNEAKVVIQSIEAAQKAYRVKYGRFTGCSYTNMGNMCNQRLGLDLPVCTVATLASCGNWIYGVSAATFNNYDIRAYRNVAATDARRRWYILWDNGTQVCLGAGSSYCN